MADFADRAVAVVGVDVEQNGDAAGPVPFEGEFLVCGAGQFAGPALDGPLDIVGRHVFSLGRDDRTTQAGIGIRIAAAVLRSDADFLDETGEDLAALGVERALLVLNCGPFRMAGHGSTSYLLKDLGWRRIRL